MTNYEWLVKNGKIYDFIDDLMFSSINLFSGKYHGLSIEKMTSRKKIIKTCIEWLQAEHKESKKYVRLDDVINVLNNPLKINVESYRGKITLSEMSRAFAEDYKDKMNRINSLAAKEIDE